MDIQKLCDNASNILKMFNKTFATPEGVNIKNAMLISAGLAGMACHEAVKATGGNFTIVTTKDKRNFYFGDDLNKLLLESEYSVLGTLRGFLEAYSNGGPKPDPESIIAESARVIGDKDHKIWGIFPCEQVYKDVREFWKSIYDDMTIPYCEGPEEWHVLFSIVLQNIMISAMPVAPVHGLFIMALECAWYISKMDDDSLSQDVSETV